VSWGHAALSLNPDVAIVLLTVGLLLVYMELNSPGAVLPGALGLTLTLIAAGSLFRNGPGATGLVLVVTGAALLLLDLLRPTPPMVAAAATLSLIGGLYRLPSEPGSTWLHAVIALVCGLVLGIGTAALTRIARRARANKAVD
jgi:membrane-bound serine protease (ClpP class)